MTENPPAAALRRSIRHLEGARSRRVSPAQADVELDSMKLETPWDDDEDEDLPQRREEDDGSEPDEHDPGEDDDEDDEEPLRVKKRAAKGGSFCAAEPR
jgi:hypothetical protein